MLQSLESKGKIGDECFEIVEELKQRIPSEMDFDVLDTKEAKEEEKKLARIYSSINRISHILLSVTTEIPKCKCEKSSKSCVNIALILSELEASDGFEFEKTGLAIYQVTISEELKKGHPAIIASHARRTTHLH